MKFARALVGALLSAIIATAAVGLVAIPATAAPTQLSAVTELPVDWTCFNSGSCLDFSGYNSGGHRGKADPNAWGTAQCRSGQNCVHYVAWRVVNEWQARDTTPAGLVAANACPMDIAPRAWDTAAAACGWVVDRSTPQAGDILQYDGGQKLNGYGSTGASGHVDFIDAVEVAESGETILYISHSGCASGANIRRTVTLTDVINAGVDIIHVPYTRDQGAFTQLATQADAAQWLYRLAGSPEVSTTLDPFSDLNPVDPAFRAAMWMHTTGIVTAAHFQAGATLDRQTLATFLYEFDALDGELTETPNVAGPADLSLSAHPTEVAWLVAAGFSETGEGNTIQPTAPVATDELAQVLYAYAGAPAVTQPARSPWYDLGPADETYTAALWTVQASVSRDPFTDVPMTHEGFSRVAAMKAQGLIAPFEDGTFNAEAPLTRQEMAAFLYGLAGRPAIKATTTTQAFADVAADHPHWAEITWMVQQGLVTGYPDNTFRPGDAVTRQALAVFLYRAAGSPAFTVPAAPSFADVEAGGLSRLEIEWATSVGALSGSNGAAEDSVAPTFSPDMLANRATLLELVAKYSPATARTAR